MPLATRVIPTILCRGRALVKGARFDSWRTVGVAAQAVRVHQARGVDEVCLLDIGATPEGRGPDLDLVAELSEMMFAPLAVGGGVRSIDDVRNLLRAGADKIVIGTAVTYEHFLEGAADMVGCQAIVAAVDVLNGEVATRCGKRVFSDADPVDWAKTCAVRGAGEILLTCVEREGTLKGYDLDLIRRVSNAVSIPVIAHGGCSGYDDMRRAINAGAHAVAAGALFQFTEATPKAASAYLKSHGIEARI